MKKKSPQLKKKEGRNARNFCTHLISKFFFPQFCSLIFFTFYFICVIYRVSSTITKIGCAGSIIVISSQNVELASQFQILVQSVAFTFTGYTFHWIHNSSLSPEQLWVKQLSRPDSLVLCDKQSEEESSEFKVSLKRDGFRQALLPSTTAVMTAVHLVLLRLWVTRCEC